MKARLLEIPFEQRAAGELSMRSPARKLLTGRAQGIGYRLLAF
jgi:hypothetical protein